MKQSFFLITLFFLGLTHLSIAQSIKFQKTIGNRTATAYSIASLPNKGFAIAGNIWNKNNSDNDFFLIKTDSLGNPLWKKTYGTTNYEYCNEMQPTSDGGYILAGQLVDLNTFESQGAIVKTDSAGNMNWKKTFKGSIFSIKETKFGNAFLACGVIGNVGAGNLDIYLVKLDLNGNIIWDRTFGGNSLEIAQSLVATSDNGVLLTGRTLSFGSGGYDVFLLKLNEQGIVQWETSYGDSLNQWANSIIINKKGNYLIAGETEKLDSLNDTIKVSFVSEIDSIGNEIQTKVFSVGIENKINNLIELNNEYYFVGTSKESDTTSFDGLMIKTDSAFNVIFSNSFGKENHDEIFGISKTLDEKIAFVGTTKSYDITTINQIWLAKTDSIGFTGCFDTSITCSTLNNDFVFNPRTSDIDSGYISSSYIWFNDTLSVQKTICTNYVPPAGINDANHNKIVRIYPNPSSNGLFYLNCEKDDWISIYDLKGNLIFKTQTINTTTEINLEKFKASILIIKIENLHRKFVEKIQIE